jgi:hypothetical protein
MAGLDPAIHVVALQNETPLVSQRLPEASRQPHRVDKPGHDAVGVLANGVRAPTAGACLQLEPSRPPQLAVDLLETTVSD